MEAACRQFSVHGFDGASMDEVAKCAHVAKATVYARFGSKAGLFMAALDELSSRLPSAEELTRGSPADVRAHLRGIAHQMLQMALSWPAIGICRMLVLPMKSAPHLGEEFWKKPLRGITRQCIACCAKPMLRNCWTCRIRHCGQSVHCSGDRRPDVADVADLAALQE